MSPSAYADIPDYDCEQPGLDPMEGGWASQALNQTDPATPKAPPARDTDVEHTTVIRLWLWDYQWKRLWSFVEANAGFQAPDDHSVRAALAPDCVQGEKSYTGGNTRFAFDLDYLARRWLRQRQVQIEALFPGDRAGRAFDLIRKLFS